MNRLEQFLTPPSACNIDSIIYLTAKNFVQLE